MSKKFNQAELAELRKKFSAIDSKLSKKSELVPKYLSEEEFENLKYCPRDFEMTTGTKWPTIGGRRTYPMSGILTDNEKRIYYDYRKETRSGDGEGRSSKKTEEMQKQIAELEKFINEQKNCPSAVKEALEALKNSLPKRKESQIQKLFGFEDYDSIKDKKFNLAYLMFRDKDGEFSNEFQPKGEELFKNGFLPLFGLKDIESSLNKLEKEYTDIKKLIVDLK